MKKLLALLVTLALLMGVACAEAPAETRARTVETDNGPVELTETFFGTDVCTLWYQADVFEAGVLYDHATLRPVGAAEDDMSAYYMIVPVEIPAEAAGDMIAEATGGYEPDWTISDVRELTSDAGAKILSVDANNGEEIHRYYLVAGEEFCLCITAIYPAADAEAWNFNLDVMTATIELLPAAEVTE